MCAIFVAVLLSFGVLWFSRRKKRHKSLARQSSTSNETCEEHIFTTPDDIMLIYQDCRELKAYAEYISQELQENEVLKLSNRPYDLWSRIWAQLENIPPRFLRRVHSSIKAYQLILFDFISVIDSKSMTQSLMDDFNQRIDSLVDDFEMKLTSIRVEIKSECGYAISQAPLFQNAQNFIISGGTFIQSTSDHSSFIYERSATSLQLQYLQLRLQYVQLGFLFV